MVLLDTCHTHYRLEIIRFKTLDQKSIHTSRSGKLSRALYFYGIVLYCVS